MRKKLLIIFMCLLPGIVMAQSTFKTNVVIQKTTPTLYLTGSSPTISFNSSMTFNYATGVLTLSGGNLSLGTNSLLLTGSISSTGSRATKIWATDLEVTNSPTINGVAISSTYAPLASPTFTGTVSGITASMVGLGNVTNASKATMFTDPTFTGVTHASGGITIGNVKTGSNVVQVDSVTSTGSNILFYHGATALNGGGGGGGTWGSITGTLGDQTDLGSALALKANLASPTFTGTVSGITKTMVGLGNVTNESKATMFTSPTFTGTVSGVTATMVGLGNVTNESKATMFTSPTFTGTVSGITKSMVGLSNVTNESKATMFSSPTFTGTVSGVTATMVGLGNVTNESKATMFTSPTFTGTVVVPSPFTLGGVSVTTTGTRLNYLSTLRSDVQAQIDDTITGSSVFVKLIPDTVQYTSAHTLALTDANKWISVIKSTSVAITIPTNTTAAIPIGTTINFIQGGNGIIVFKVASGVTKTSLKDSTATDGKWSWAALYKRGTNNWCLYGNIGE